MHPDPKWVGRISSAPMKQIVGFLLKRKTANSVSLQSSSCPFWTIPQQGCFYGANISPWPLRPRPVPESLTNTNESKGPEIQKVSKPDALLSNLDHLRELFSQLYPFSIIFVKSIHRIESGFAGQLLDLGLSTSSMKHDKVIKAFDCQAGHYLSIP